MISPKTRTQGLFLFCGGLLFVGTLIITIRLSQDVRMEAFQHLGEGLMPVVEAIEKYYVEHGEYPQSLEGLVPQYLQELPGTDMGNYSDYRYLVGAEANRYEENPWVIEMNAAYGMGFDSFMYFPLQNYPASGYGGGIERLGRWAYVHE